MKKFWKRLFVTSLAAVTCLTATACGRGEEGGDEPGTTVTLELTLYAAGYGDTWITEAINNFKKTHPEVGFNVRANQLAIDAAKTELENENCKSDVVIVSATDYDDFVVNGYIDDLTGLYNTNIPGTEKAVKNAILPQVYNAYITSDNKIYGVPWQANNPSGLIYNKKMFRDKVWPLPETMDDFWALCDRISSDTNGEVAPLVYGGADSFGYLLNNLPQWLCEYYGYDNMINFMKLSSPKVYEDQAEGRTKIYQTLAKMTMGKTASGKNISLEGSSGSLAQAAQTNFVNGLAAMIPSGQYYFTEMKEYMTLKNFEAGYLPMPHINADKKSGDGQIDTSKIRFSTDNGVLAVPTSSTKKELAKEFLLSMFTKDSYTSFVKANNGLTRPFKGIEVDKTDFPDYTLEAFNYFNAGDEAGQTVYMISKNRLMEKYNVPMFFAHGGNYFPQIVNCASFDAAMAVANGCVANEMAGIMAKWDPVNNTF